MEISNVPQGAATVSITTQLTNAPQTVDKVQTADTPVVEGQKDFQVDVKDGLKAKLAEFVNLLQNRDQLIKSLPEDVQKAVAELLRQMAGDKELPQGLVALLQGQKSAAEQLKNMGSLLEFAAILNKDEHVDVQKILQEILENFTSKSDKTPDQAAKDLLQLAKQLFSVTTMPEGNLKQAVEQLVQQALPENMQQLTPDEQKTVNQLTKLLGKDMPTQLQQLVQQHDLPELPGVWATLKAADAWQLKDIRPQTLQAAAELLRELVQEMPNEKATGLAQLEQFVKTLPTEAGNQAAVAGKMEELIKTLPSTSGGQSAPNAQLEKFIKSLPPEIGKALQQALNPTDKQGNIPDNLRALAETFSNAALLNEKMSSDVQSFVVKIVENFAGKSSPVSANVNDVLAQLAKQFTNTATTADELKNMVNQLKNQLFAGNPKLLEKSPQVLEQLSQIFEQNIPQALQEGAAKHKMGEVPKIWVLLKALGAEQWQNLDSQNLQKSANTVKELANSMYKSTALAGEKQAEQSVLSFSVPLQVAEGVFYPAHIHIFHQENENEKEQFARKFETWLRVSVDTEHMGMVDSVFRLYADDKLDVRVIFPTNEAANEFKQELPNIRKDINATKLTLNDILVNKA